MFDMRRREAITLLGGAAWPLAVRAQQTEGVRRIGVLSGFAENDPEMKARLAALRQGLEGLGWSEGRNIKIDYSWGAGDPGRQRAYAAELVASKPDVIFATPSSVLAAVQRETRTIRVVFAQIHDPVGALLPALAADLVRRQVAVIAATGGTASVLAAKVATATIPIVFTTGGDPVKLGLVASHNRPGGNVTGVSWMNNTTAPKRLELLRALLPGAATIGLLRNPANPNAAAETLDIQTAASALGQQIEVENAGNEREIDAAFARFVRGRVDALFVAADPLFTDRRDQVNMLAARHAIPASYVSRINVVAGGLMSYGADYTDAYRQMGLYTSRILKGEKPADLPVQQSVKFEFVINLKIAKALRLTVPDKVLALADEVIE